MIKGKAAVVTGAGTGIGQGIAIELGKRGVSVVVHYHGSQKGAQETVRIIKDSGATIQPNLNPGAMVLEKVPR